MNPLEVPHPEMSNFCAAQGATQGFALRPTQGTPQAQTRGERSAVQKEPFMDGHRLICH